MGVKKVLKDILPYYFTRKYFKKKKFPNSFKESFEKKSALLKDNRFICKYEDILACLNENTPDTAFDAHYIYHTAWAARVLAKSKPLEHIDISSSLYFVSNNSAFIPITFYDYRPANLTLSNLNCKAADILNLPFEDNSIQSLSCMHVVEHIGLERYGDPFNPKGDLQAIAELVRVVKPNGQLLFVVPIGKIARIQYNAHRIYTYKQIIEYFHELQLLEFSLITDNNQFIDIASESDADLQNYGCGCFLFKK